MLKKFAAAIIAAFVLVAPAAVIAQVTVSPGPVESSTIISVGTLAGQVLTWIAAAFSIPIGAVLTSWLIRLMKVAGVENTNLLKDQLGKVILNGLNDGAARAQTELAGRGQIQIKDRAVQLAVAYTQAHAQETIKALGLDPKSGQAVDAIKARIETAIVDETQPTNPVLAPATSKV